MYRLFLGILSCVTMGLGGCGNDAPAPQGDALVLVTSADQAPFEFHLTSQGQDQVVGFDIDVAHAVAKRLGKTLEIKDMDFNGIIPALSAGRADIAMASLNVTPERQNNVDFSIPYYTMKYAVVFTKEKPIENSNALKGKTLAAQLGSVTEQYGKTLAEKDPTITLTSRNKSGDIIQELKAGRIDGGLMDESAALAFVKKNTDLGLFVFPADSGNSVAIALPKNSPLTPRVNEILTDMDKNGELEALKNKWFS